MRRKEGRFAKSLYEDVSIRAPHTRYEEYPKILDAAGAVVDADSEASVFTLQAKVVRTLLTRKNEMPDPLYLQENVYYVVFKKCLKKELTFIDTLYEVLWHKHVEKAGEKPTFSELLDTEQGVLKIESIEEHRNTKRLVCQLYELA